MENESIEKQTICFKNLRVPTRSIKSAVTLYSRFFKSCSCCRYLVDIQWFVSEVCSKVGGLGKRKSEEYAKITNFMITFKKKKWRQVKISTERNTCVLSLQLKNRHSFRLCQYWVVKQCHCLFELCEYWSSAFNSHHQFAQSRT